MQTRLWCTGMNSGRLRQPRQLVFPLKLRLRPSVQRELGFWSRCPALILLTPHPLLAGVGPSYLPVHLSPSSPPCSTQRSAAAAWKETLYPGELSQEPAEICTYQWAGWACLPQEGTNRGVLVWVFLRQVGGQFQLYSELSPRSFSSINLSFCLNASGKHVPNSIGEKTC